MSQENVEVVRRFYAAFNAGDMEAVRETWRPSVRRSTPTSPLGASWKAGRRRDLFVGREAVMRQWERNREPWGDAITVEPISIIDAGDRVIVRQIVHGVGQGPEVHGESTAVSTYRNGRIVLIDYFWDYAEALEAAGLSE
jgi:ketosteroid isomerase-like protein